MIKLPESKLCTDNCVYIDRFIWAVIPEVICLSGILYFLRSWYMYVFSILSALQLHIFDLQ